METPNESDLEDVINKGAEQEIRGTSKFSGMTYEQAEQAVLDAIRWIIDGGENPMPD